jgi:AcrR family transcriptional regulator
VPGVELGDVIRGFRREQVITTALQIFGRTGSLEVSLEEIAAEAGISRSTLYNHFADRGELVTACAAFTQDRLAGAMCAAIADDGPAEALLSRFFSAALVCLDENPGFYRLATSLKASHGAAEAAFDDELTSGNARGAELIDRIGARLSTETGVDAGEAASVIGIVLLGALEQRARSKMPPPPDQTAAVLARVLLGGLAGKDS